MTMLNVTPGAFTLALSIQLLTAVVLGGLGSLAGAVWGGIILVLVPPFLTDFAASHGLSSASASVPIVGYGLVLIVVMLAFPTGIQGAIRRLLGPVEPAAAAQVSAHGPALARYCESRPPSRPPPTEPTTSARSEWMKEGIR